MNRLFVVLLLLAGGCYSPGYRDCEVTCGASVCPSGLSCVSGYCRVDPNATQTCESLLGDAGTDGALGDGPPASVWSTPTVLLTVASGDRDPTCKDDLSEIYYVHSNDLYHVLRNATMQYGNPQLEPISDPNAVDNGPDISSDGLSMVWGDTTGTNRRLRFSTRDMTTNAWSTPTVNSVLQAANDAQQPTRSRDGALLIFERTGQPATAPLWSSTFSGGAWSNPQPLSEVATWGVSRPQSAMLSTDKLTLYFHAAPSGGTSMLFESHRPDMASAFGVPTPIDSLHAAGSNEMDPWISRNGKTMVFLRTTGSTTQIMKATRP